MITQVTPQTRQAFLAVLQKSPIYIGACMGCNYQVYKDFPQSMQFFIVDADCVLQIKGKSAFLCGTPQDETELAAFLSFCGADDLKSDGYIPQGWSQAFLLYNMQYSGEQPQISCKAQIEIEQATNLTDVMEMLRDEAFTGEKLDNFYADACRRKNQGFAQIWAARQKGKLVATAGAYSMYQNEAYLAAVETLPMYRAQGIASALVAALSHHLHTQGWRVTLSCKQNRVHLYSCLGFATVNTAVAAVPKV
ncbi:MAG: GNAT family N-acetyltransferase [Oscillospiraceae bacterium]|nr:GNAT family N-acetyltransferase [Oscillospiraceae bacterium]